MEHLSLAHKLEVFRCFILRNVACRVEMNELYSRVGFEVTIAGRRGRWTAGKTAYFEKEQDAEYFYNEVAEAISLQSVQRLYQPLRSVTYVPEHTERTGTFDRLAAWWGEHHR